MREEFSEKVVSSWITGLLHAYSVAMVSHEPDDPHQKLLLEHALALCKTLKQKQLECQLYSKTGCKIKLSTAEALAFMQWWTLVALPLQIGSQEHFIVSYLIGEIDQWYKSQRVHKMH